MSHLLREKKRCCWCNEKNPRYVAYHDHEWGVPVHDDHKLYEMLLLESFQAGLSWECVLNKREAFREAFDGFDAEQVAQYDQAKLDRLAQEEGIIRHRLKIKAAVTNARVFLAIRKEYGSFDQYLRSFTNGHIYHEWGRTTSPLSDTLSHDLRRRGMKFMGSTIVYSLLQAIGVIHSHEEGCFLHRKA